MKLIRHDEGKLVVSKSGDINIFSMFDVSIMDAFGFSSEEYDYFCEKVTDEELEIIASLEQDLSFSNKRKVLEIIHKYKEEINEKINN